MKNNRNNSGNLSAFSLIEISIVVLIVGILIAGITQSSRLIALAKVNTAKSLTQGSPAASIQNLSFWIESTSVASFDDANIEDGEEVEAWNDINPQASTKAHLSGSSGPIYRTEVINGLPAICFNNVTNCGASTGTTNSLSTSNFPNLTSGTSTVFAVVKLPATLAAETILGKLTSGGANPNIKFGTNATAANGWNYYDESGTYSASGGTAVVASNNYVVSVVYNGNSDSTGNNTSDGVAIFQNGEGKGKDDAGGASPNVSADGALFVGEDGTSAGYFTGYIGEIIIYDRALKREERQSIESYLGRKWGIKMVSETY